MIEGVSKTSSGLRVLTMTLVNEPQPDCVRFAYTGSTEAVAAVAIPLASLCIPEDGDLPEPWDLAAMAKEGGHPALLVEFLRQIEGDRKAGGALWLDFAAPSGGLPLYAWERFMDPFITAPMLRLPSNPPVQVSVRQGPLAVALCASLPRAKAAFHADDLLLRGVMAVLAAHPESHCHLFRDRPEEESGSFRAQLESFAGRERFTLHDPRDAEKFGAPPRSEGGPSAEVTASPWLEWMKEALQGKTVEMVHFFCHGYLCGDYGHLAFAESPVFNRDRTWARFVGADELYRFLNHLNIPCLGMTEPPRNFSPKGLRSLTVEMARKRQGVVMFHDLEEDRQTRDLEEAMRLLLAPKHVIRPDELRSVILYGDPRRFAGRLGGAPPGDTTATAATTKGLPSAWNRKRWFGKLRGLVEHGISKEEIHLPELAGRLTKTLEGYVVENAVPIPSWANTATRLLRENLDELEISRKMESGAETTRSIAKETADWNRGREEALEFISGLVEASLKKQSRSMGEEVEAE
jgi:hypothetical protein